jgi:hypothetical protein
MNSEVLVFIQPSIHGDEDFNVSISRSQAGCVRRDWPKSDLERIMSETAIRAIVLDLMRPLAKFCRPSQIFDSFWDGYPR